MPDERRGHAVVAEERFLERQDHREAAHGGEPAHPPRGPGPQLRRDVVQHGNAGGVRRRRGAQMVPRVVDQDGEIVALGPERLAHPREQAEVRGQLPQRLDESHDRHPLHAVEHGGTGGLEARAAERLERGRREAPSQRRHHGGGVRVPRRLARRDVDAGRAAHGRALARGEAWTAPATRQASARACAPAAPDTTTASSPRTARRKLSSSSLSGSASGASSRTCSTICSSVVAPIPRHPARSRKKSPLPCARSREKYPVGWKMRSLRVRSRETRLAVTLAMAPFANSMRAFAMSTWGVRIGMPVARTSLTSAPTSSSTRARPWIMRARMTATAVPRGWNGARRSISRDGGSSRYGAAARTAPLNRSTCPTCSTIPRSAARRTSCSAAATESASGFSINRDRKSTRLNSSHGYISYAVFCLKKKNLPAEVFDNRARVGGKHPGSPLHFCAR